MLFRSYKNVPFDYVTYSSVIVQQVNGGYAVFGYGVTDPYFNILASQANGNFQLIEAGGATVRVPRDHTNTVVRVPYGFVFSNQQRLCLQTAEVAFSTHHSPLSIRQYSSPHL